MPEPRYRIQRRAPHPVKLSDFGVSRSPDGADVEFNTLFDGFVSEDEFRAMYGDDANIVHSMVHEIETRDGWTALAGVEEVLVCERDNTMQELLINAMCRAQGIAPPEGAELAERARCYENISARAAQFLLETYNNGHEPETVVIEPELERAKQNCLALSDFLLPADKP